MIYESEKDLLNQRKAMERVESIHGWKIYELHRRYIADWALFRKEDNREYLKGFAEYKRRNNMHDQFDPVFLEAKKWSECRAICESFDVPFYYVNEWDDRIGIAEPTVFDAKWSKKSMQKSLRRDDPNDDYLMIHVPIERFELYHK